MKNRFTVLYSSKVWLLEKMSVSKNSFQDPQPQLPSDSLPRVLGRHSDAFEFLFHLSVYFLARETYMVLFFHWWQPQPSLCKPQDDSQKSLGQVLSSGSSDLHLPFVVMISEGSAQDCWAGLGRGRWAKRRKITIRETIDNAVEFGFFFTSYDRALRHIGRYLEFGQLICYTFL